MSMEFSGGTTKAPPPPPDKSHPDRSHPDKSPPNMRQKPPESKKVIVILTTLLHSL